MKKLVALTLLGLSAIACVAAADAAVIVNTCTSTYFAINSSVEVASGWDTVGICTDNSPSIKVTKYVKNLRTGIEADYMVSCIAGDTVEFRITWSNIGNGTADTVTLTDYIPSGVTFVTGSVTNTETNCATASAAESGGVITYILTGAAGMSTGPNASGEFKFRATIN